MFINSLKLFLVKQEVVFDLLTLYFLALCGWICVIIVINRPQIVIVGRFDAGILIGMVFDTFDAFIAELAVQNSLRP